MLDDWKNILKSFVKHSKIDLFPLLVYKIEPPSTEPFPDNLKYSQDIIDFYSICDGGFIADFNWYKKSELNEKNTEWIQGMENYYEDGSNPFNENHLILGNDSGGAPLIWNSKTDKMFTFWFKGGDWEPINKSFNEFMDYYFLNYEGEIEDDLWYAALQQVNKINL